MLYYKSNLDKNRLLGQILKSERIEQNISLRQLANYVGITAQYLSEIERGERNPSEYALNKIEKELDIVLNIDEKKLKIFDKLYDDLFYSFISFDRKNVIEIFNNYIIEIGIDHKSLYYPIFLLSELIFLISKEDEYKKIQNLINKIELYVWSFDYNKSITYHMICVYFYALNKQFDLSKKNLEKLFPLNFSLSQKEQSIIEYFISYYYLNINELEKSLEYCEKAILTFTNLCLFSSVYESLLVKAIIYTKLDFLDDAENIYKNLLNIKGMNNCFHSRVLSNYAFCKIKTADYDNAILLYKESSLLNHKKGYDILFVVYIYLKRMEYDKANEILKKNNFEQSKDAFLLSITEVIDSMLENDSKTRYTKIEKFIYELDINTLNLEQKNCILLYIEIILSLYKRKSEFHFIVSLYETKFYLN